ncbi:MAG: PSD1 and planctomycete cytochrome C domain-containing protein [Verrucomicrobiales bacterium]|nr:PSD1 and planctomycete cytochrome C domain-containing protein [Verrucomicrobiales bacterium]
MKVFHLHEQALLTVLISVLFTSLPYQLQSAEKPSPSPKAAITYEQHIRPILKANCFHCHGEGDKLKGDLDLRLRRFIVKGGENGAAIIPGDLKKSLLHQQLIKGEMPPEDKHLAAEEIALIGKWIAAGAPTLRDEPDSISGFVITEEERNFWSLRPVKSPALPQVKSTELVETAIDAFLLAKLEKAGFSFNPSADRKTLIRRLSFDLTGLPPSPTEIDTFLSDKNPGAYERVVDRLLDSEHFGERWARHWLDVAGYSDSEGYTARDTVRDWSWKYRDYIIQAFNHNMPFDQFIREQLAGDEMVKAPYKNLNSEQQSKLAATGFLRMAPDGTGSAPDDQKIARNQVVADTIQIVSTTLLGTTMMCAQCHNHRYDPIPQTDYYSMRAIFEPAFDLVHWRNPSSRRISLYTDQNKADAAIVEEKAKKLDAARLKLQKKYVDAAVEIEIAKLPKEIQAPLRIARNTEEKKRTEAQKLLLKDNPRIKKASGGSLYLYNRKASDEIKKLATNIKTLRDTKPPLNYIRALWEKPGAKPPVTHLFNRGDHQQPKQAVPPAGLTVLGEWGGGAISDNNPELPTTGRRLAYAQKLTNGKHPLVSRVLVNRFWSHLFGQGIVGTLGDFGTLGTQPSHPELLDWMAADFTQHGWDFKRTIKQMLMSSAYRQSSDRTADLNQLDPQNHLLGRMSVRRLDAESIRDSVLTISNKINTKLYGKPVPVMEDSVGQIVVGKENKDGEGKPKETLGLEGQEYRRSLYIQARRSRPLAVLQSFDRPDMVEANCTERNSSTVAPQALMLMNSQFITGFSVHIAERLKKDHPKDLSAQIKLAWMLIYGRPASDTEASDALSFIENEQRILPAATPAKKPVKSNTTALATDPATLSLATFCQALLSSNEFLYLN